MRTYSIKLPFLFLLLTAPFQSQAQDSTVSSGIYITASDFKREKLFEEVACDGDQDGFNKHDLFQRRTFDVLIKGEKRTFLKKDIFAYRDCKNKVWRFNDNREYELVEKKKINIYRISKVVLNGLTVEKDPVYYFSKGIEGKIEPLTLENLKKEFSGNKVFCSLLDSEFKTDDLNKAIHSYDFASKMYRVNYLMIEAAKK